LTFSKQGKALEAQRLEERVNTDLHLLEKVGYCSGIETYSMPLAGRAPGEPQGSLLDFFPAAGDCLFIDEPHVSVPHLSMMHSANYARKQKLIQHGFRMPGAKENRSLSFDKFWRSVPRAVFMSATPSACELAISTIEVVLDDGLIWKLATTVLRRRSSDPRVCGPCHRSSAKCWTLSLK
jgi:excinuclease ABC subunit B